MREVQHETSPPTISASSSERCRAPGRLARSLGASLSIAAGADHHLDGRRRPGRHAGTPDRPVVVGAPGPAIRRREPPWRRPADGYTLLLVNPANAINATLYERLNFNFIRDIEPIAGIIRGPFVMLVKPSFPATSVSEFIVYAKAHPGTINFASGGTGFATHLAGELFKVMTGVNMVHVPYRGQAPALTDLLGGQVQVMFDPVVSSIAHVRAGELRPLAVTTSTRSDALPDIPTVGEFVAGYEASVWFGVGAPKNTPTKIVDRLNKEINAGLADPKMKARLADLGGTVLPGTPADFGKLIADETEKWGKVIRAANIKPQG